MLGRTIWFSATIDGVTSFGLCFSSVIAKESSGSRPVRSSSVVSVSPIEIKQVARLELVLAAEDAIALLERISPALEHVDSSSGAIGSAVNRTIAELVPVIAGAPADART